MQPTSFTELKEFAQLIANSDLAPKDYRGKPGNIIVACTMGADVGLSPMQALSSIAVINGKGCLYGDGLLAIVQASAVCEDVIETFSGSVATCVAKRHGRAEVTRTFSIDDAKKAKLWGKAGPWTDYPFRMLQMRARAFALRDAFADVLKGLQSAEEVGDYQIEAKASVVARAPQAAVQATSAPAALSAGHDPETGEVKPAGEPLRFLPKYPELGGTLIADAAPAAILEYIGKLEQKQNDARVKAHLGDVTAAYDAIVAAEIDAAANSPVGDPE